MRTFENRHYSALHPNALANVDFNSTDARTIKRFRCEAYNSDMDGYEDLTSDRYRIEKCLMKPNEDSGNVPIGKVGFYRQVQKLI